MSEQLAYTSPKPSDEELARGPLTPIEQLGALVGAEEAAKIHKHIQESNAYILNSKVEKDPQTAYKQKVETEMAEALGFWGHDDLEQKMRSGEVTAEDLYDETGALTANGRIAAGYVSGRYYSMRAFGDEDETARLFSDALSQNLVQSGDAAHDAASAENYPRTVERAGHFVAQTAKDMDRPTPYNEIPTDPETREKDYLDSDATSIGQRVKSEHRKEYPEQYPKDGSYEQNLENRSHEARAVEDVVHDAENTVDAEKSDQHYKQKFGMRGAINRAGARVRGEYYPGSRYDKNTPMERPSGGEVAAEANKLAYQAGKEAQASGEAAAQKATAEQTAQEEQSVPTAL